MLNDRLAQILETSGPDLAKAVSSEFDNLYRELEALRQEVATLAAPPSLRPQTASGMAVSPLESVTIEPFHMLLPQDGFYALEHTPEGTPFRWTGPAREFRFDVFVDRVAGADLRLLALSSINFEIQKTVTLVADGESILVKVTTQPPRLAITAFLPPREDRAVTSLVFAVPAALVPPGGKDPRALGIAFARLYVAARMTGLASSEESERLAAQ